jgi:hypothetical protein
VSEENIVGTRSVPKAFGVNHAPDDDRARSSAALPYFRTADRVQMLLNQVHLWSGTRWQHSGTRPNQMRCGVTGDCLFWVHVFKAIGALPARVVIPDYRKMEAAGDRMRMLRECIEAAGRAELVWDRIPKRAIPDKRVGDVLIFENGMSGAHCGLVIRDFPCHFFHVGQNGAVVEPLNQKHWHSALAVMYRLLEAPVGTQCSTFDDDQPRRSAALPTGEMGT